MSSNLTEFLCLLNERASGQVPGFMLILSFVQAFRMREDWQDRLESGDRISKQPNMIDDRG